MEMAYLPDEWGTKSPGPYKLPHALGLIKCLYVGMNKFAHLTEEHKKKTGDFVLGQEGLRTARYTIDQDSFEIQGQRCSSAEYY